MARTGIRLLFRARLALARLVAISTCSPSLREARLACPRRPDGSPGAGPLKLVVRSDSGVGGADTGYVLGDSMKVRDGNPHSGRLGGDQAEGWERPKQQQRRRRSFRNAETAFVLVEVPRLRATSDHPVVVVVVLVQAEVKGERVAGPSQHRIEGEHLPDGPPSGAVLAPLEIERDGPLGSVRNVYEAVDLRVGVGVCGSPDVERGSVS